MRSATLHLVLALFCVLPGGSLVERYHELGREREAAGDVAGARAAYERVLEREDRHLPTLNALALLEQRAGERDRAVDYAGRFLDIWRHLRERPRELLETERGLRQLVVDADPLRKRLDDLRRKYVGKLLDLAQKQMDDAAWHSARMLLIEARATDPEHPDLGAGLDRIELEGGNELAVEDETGGADPLAGVTPEWVEENDPLHVKWDAAWELETEHYRIRTNAGYRTLMTVANAMEQMQVFYRAFHRYKTDGGKVPVANVHIFKDSQEYKTLGHAPTDWAGGHWDGRSVVTYDHREGGEGSLRDTLQTLFHEASHQFTSLAGGSGVPSWLNEGMASFFEGTRLLSNGKVDWNLVAPGRLYPLLDDLRKDDRNHLADVIVGRVDDYRVYYPWGWGIVYYLFNAEDEFGRLVYRPLMKEYFQEYATSDHLARFEEFFVQRAKLPGVTDIESFEARFIEFVQRLEEEDKGLVDAARRYEERGDQQVALADFERAVELYDRALDKDPDHPEVLWKLAGALEALERDDRAAGVLRQWMAVVELDGDESPETAERRERALERIRDLDPIARRLSSLREGFHADSVALAREYREMGFPLTALRVLRGPATARPPSVEARDLYFAIGDESGASLERWRLLFNEEDLTGFYGGGEESFRVSDGVILARITGDEDTAPKGGAPRTGPIAAPAAGGSFAFRRLFIDREPAGDWSLSAELAFGDDGRMAGLCFGKKADGLFHGIALLPEGYVDLSQFGTDGKPMVRTKVDLAGEWNRLRMDVAGTRLVVYLNGAIVLEHQFASRASLKGDFGLLAGLGRSSFRDVKLLEYDPGLPRRERIGRRRAASRAALSADGLPQAPQRAEPGRKTYAGEAPPALGELEWIGDPPAGGDLDRLVGWPVVLAFFETATEPTHTIRPALERVAEAHGELGIPVLTVSDELRERVEPWLAQHEWPWPIGIDDRQRVYADYAIFENGLPRVLLLDVDGTVVWEGNPDWDEEFGSYLDEPLDDLVQRRHLARILSAKDELGAAEAAFSRGEYGAAFATWKSIAGLDVQHPVVAAAEAGVRRVEGLAERLLERAAARLAEGRLLQAARLQAEVRAGFEGTLAAEKARRAEEELDGRREYKRARQMENRLARAEDLLADGKLDRARSTVDGTVGKLEEDDDPWVVERTRLLADGLAAGRSAEELLAAYRAAFPELARRE